MSQQHLSAAPPGEVVSNVTVEKFSDTNWQVTLDTELAVTCSSRVPLFAVDGVTGTKLSENIYRYNGAQTITIQRLQRHTIGVVGTFDVTFKDHTVTSKFPMIVHNDDTINSYRKYIDDLRSSISSLFFSSLLFYANF